MSYDQNMNESSIWWGTIYAERNLTAMEKESENQYKPGKLPDIPAVAWWQIGNDVKSVFNVNSFLILILLRLLLLLNILAASLLILIISLPSMIILSVMVTGSEKAGTPSQTQHMRHSVEMESSGARSLS